MRTMRSIVRRTRVPARAFSSFILVGLVAAESGAQAETSPRATSPSKQGTTVIFRGGAPWIHLGGVYTGPARADVETRGRTIVREHASFIASAALVTSGVDRFGDGDTIVRYEQSHLGLPVIGRGAAVRLSASGQPIATVLDLESDLPSGKTPTVTAAAAAAVASSQMPIGASAKDAHLVVWPTLDRGTRLAYAVVPRVPTGLPTAPRVIVDAIDGEVLEARDMVTFIAKANMYASNPIKTPKLASLPLALPPTGSSLSNEFIEATNCIDKRTTRPLSLYGTDLDVHVCDLVQTATPNADGDYIYTPTDIAGSPEARSDTFSEVSIYFHAAKAYAFFRDLAGKSDAQVVEDKPLRLVSNLQLSAGMANGNFSGASNPDTPLETFQNAFFSPAGEGLGEIFEQLYGFDGGALWFGQGPSRDYAYDGDVVYHEFTHAVVDATLKLGAWHVDALGAVDAPSAMNEGLADYFSSALTGDPDVGEYASEDLGGTGGAIRTLSNRDKCPTSLVGEAHNDSTLFSGALWQARTSLAESDRPKFDATLYMAMRANPGRGDLGYDDLANLFLATLNTDLPTGAAALEAAMKDRGVLPFCDRVLPFTGTPITASDRRIGFASPGKQSVGLRDIAPGILQVRADLPPNTVSVTVSFTIRGGGSAGTGGPNAATFTPVVLGKLGKAITWDTKAKKIHDADLSVNVDSSSQGSVSAVLDIPEDQTADSIFVQIANTGTRDGSYDGLSLSFTSRPAAGGDSAVAGSATTTTTTVDTGCTASGKSRTALVFPGMLAVVGVLAGLRSMKRRRPC